MGNKPVKRGRKSADAGQMSNKENQAPAKAPETKVNTRDRPKEEGSPKKKPKNKSKSDKPSSVQKSEHTATPEKGAPWTTLEKSCPQPPTMDKSKKSTDNTKKKPKIDPTKCTKTDAKVDQKTKIEDKGNDKTSIKSGGKTEEGKIDFTKKKEKPHSDTKSKQAKETATNNATTTTIPQQKLDKKPVSEKAKSKSKAKPKSCKKSSKPKSKLTPNKPAEPADPLEQVAPKQGEKSSPVGNKAKHQTDKEEDKANESFDKSIISAATDTMPPSRPKENNLVSAKKEFMSRPIATIKKNIDNSRKIGKESTWTGDDASKGEKQAEPWLMATVKTTKICQSYNSNKSPPFVIGVVSRPQKAHSGKEAWSSVKTRTTETDDCLKTGKTVNDIVTNSLDSKIEVDLLSKSNLRTKENNPRASGELSADGELTPIFKEEFERLYDKITELNRAELILKESYRNLIRSLVNLNKQEKIKTTSGMVEKERPTEMSQKTTNMLTTISDLKCTVVEEMNPTDNGNAVNGGGKERQKKKDIDINTRYRLPLETNKSDMSNEVVLVDSRFAMERFLNPLSRDDTFRDLFGEVEMLNQSLAQLKEFFDTDGDFLIQEYENSDYRINRSTFDMVRQKAQMLLTIVQQITRIYNQDLLDMFRIK